MQAEEEDENRLIRRLRGELEVKADSSVIVTRIQQYF